MALVHVFRPDGSEVDVAVDDGGTLMEAIKDAGVDELLALCGGNLSCATCHVYVDPEILPNIAGMSAEENELLDASPYRKTNSRLSCQIPCSEALAGGRIEIAPAE